jgi:hypothetical protein
MEKTNHWPEIVRKNASSTLGLLGTGGERRAASLLGLSSIRDDTG